MKAGGIHNEMVEKGVRLTCTGVCMQVKRCDRRSRREGKEDENGMWQLENDVIMFFPNFWQVQTESDILRPVLRSRLWSYRIVCLGFMTQPFIQWSRQNVCLGFLWPYLWSYRIVCLGFMTPPFIQWSRRNVCLGFYDDPLKSTKCFLGFLWPCLWSFEVVILFV